jgi:hypothetical protein
MGSDSLLAGYSQNILLLYGSIVRFHRRNTGFFRRVPAGFRELRTSSTFLRRFFGQLQLPISGSLNIPAKYHFGG